MELIQYIVLYREKDNNTVQLIGPCSEGCSFSRLYIPMKGLFNSCDYKRITKQDNNTIAYRDMSDGVIKFGIAKNYFKRNEKVYANVFPVKRATTTLFSVDHIIKVHLPR